MPEVSGEARSRLLYNLACAFAARIEIDQLIPLELNPAEAALGGSMRGDPPALVFDEA
jgi:hypothetical protein